jgi:hypothetical protein
MLATCVLDAKVTSNPALGKFKLLIEAIRNRYAALKRKGFALPHLHSQALYPELGGNRE